MSDQPKKYYWEDFVVGTTREFGGLTVTKEEILQFARQFDPQPFHVDEEAARRSPFGGLIASGWHTAGLSMKMWCDAFLLETASLGSPGVEKLKWTKPVRARRHAARARDRPRGARRSRASRRSASSRAAGRC